MSIDLHTESDIDADAASVDPTEGGQHPSRSRRVLHASGVALLLAVVVALFPSAPAGAATLAGNGGSIGNVWVNGPMINAWETSQPGLYGTRFFMKNFTAGGITVGRAPATYQQRVTVVSSIQRYDGRWVDIRSQTRSGIVSGGGTVSFGAWHYSPTNVPNNRPSYRVVHVIYWTDTATGTLIGLTGVLPNSYGDNLCSTRNFRCSTYTDGLNF